MSLFRALVKPTSAFLTPSSGCSSIICGVLYLSIECHTTDHLHSRSVPSQFRSWGSLPLWLISDRDCSFRIVYTASFLAFNSIPRLSSWSWCITHENPLRPIFIASGIQLTGGVLNHALPHPHVFHPCGPWRSCNIPWNGDGRS